MRTINKPNLAHRPHFVTFAAETLKMMKLLTSENWKDYELIDCGDFEKLERFGEYVLIRPEPQAIWNRKLTSAEWEKMAHARFVRDIKGSNRFGENENGGWTFLKKMPQTWQISYQNVDFQLKIKLSLTSFGHIGVFPEQAQNWDFIYNSTKEIIDLKPRILNLFAYTGVASLAARAAGGDVTHLDSVKQVVRWGSENMQLSNLADIHWVVEDALKFVTREVKRGKTYHGIIMDPPAYGRGPAGERWRIADSLNEIVNLSSKLLEPKHSFFVLSLYSMGFSALIGRNITESCYPGVEKDFGELFIQSKGNVSLPLGTYLRFKKA